MLPTITQIRIVICHHHDTPIVVQNRIYLGRIAGIIKFHEPSEVPCHHAARNLSYLIDVEEHMEYFMSIVQFYYFTLGEDFSHLRKHVIEMRLSPKVIHHDEAATKHELSKGFNLRGREVRPARG